MKFETCINNVIGNIAKNFSCILTETATEYLIHRETVFVSPYSPLYYNTVIVWPPSSTICLNVSLSATVSNNIVLTSGIFANRGTL